MSPFARAASISSVRGGGPRPRPRAGAPGGDIFSGSPFSCILGRPKAFSRRYLFGTWLDEAEAEASACVDVTWAAPASLPATSWPAGQPPEWGGLGPTVFLT